MRGCRGYRCGVQTVPVTVSMDTCRGLTAIVFGRFLSMSDGWTEGVSGEWEMGIEWVEMLRGAAESGFEIVLNFDGKAALLSHQTRHGAAVLLAEQGWSHLQVTAMGESAIAASSLLKAFEAITPRPTYDNASTVDVTFWSQDPRGGGMRYRRALDRLSFGTVERNYPFGVRAKVKELSAMTEGPANGRLFVFHGPAGTGKSRCLQTLASEWSSWCDISYLVDPDQFFRDASYMTDVMLGDRDSDRWRLVVCEDGDEFIDQHAKHRVGYGVSRLLNMADGLVGQGLKVMVLISTNVPAVKFSKAVTRPGRCAGVIEFPRFTHEEATEWLAEDGITATFERPPTLAQLYAAKHGNVVEDEDDA